jgi:hypothetical protein
MLTGTINSNDAIFIIHTIAALFGIGSVLYVRYIERKENNNIHK